MICSLHWYLAIICNPEFVLQPPPPPEAVAPQVQTRKRKRDSETVEIDDPPSVSPDPPPLAATQPSHGRSGSEAEEGTVEAMLETHCSISQAGKDKSSPTIPASPDVMEINDDLQLSWPLSDMIEIPMDVDEIPSGPGSDVATMGSSRTSVEVESPSTIGARSTDVSSPDIVEVDMSMQGDTDSEVNVARSSAAVPVTRFYASASKKGKERAPTPFPTNREVDITVTEEGEEQVAPEAEPEPMSFDANK